MSDIPRHSTPALHALAQLAEPSRPRLDASRMVAVFAHPDDETLALGAQLCRLKGLRIVIVTDGAPRDLADAGRHGFADAAAYAQARREELAAALREGDAADMQVSFLNVPDQGVAHALADVARRLVAALGDADIVITHAYEGGHPDHDGVAFAAHAAVRAVNAQGRAVEIIEAPFYRLGDEGEFQPQHFEPIPGSVAVQLVLDPEDVSRKARMIAAYATQHETLAQFPLQAERFRNAPDYDFGAPPNGGHILYERHSWGLDGPQWLAKVAAARQELGLPDQAPDPTAPAP
ncbi:hypothetical protein GCM10007036_44650 [Alsobacter metallidurans]|uniref:LmbE family N-acetylglucosaminyl deacetylase n=1 Tax=Alsobacter metallidurans TaxID=340221 RepID=A0A917IAD4_9HYPH|nr:PIG-L family deacetylase [Alsobacter metallidurans]GGH32621.1 hypothetical protein GCM10007036_44650 [Alsobacter metallidurans]